jgi:hypothetical protein
MSASTLDEAAILNSARHIEAADARRRYIEGAAQAIPRSKSRLDALLLIDQADRGFLERSAQDVATRADWYCPNTESVMSELVLSQGGRTPGPKRRSISKWQQSNS